MARSLGKHIRATCVTPLDVRAMRRELFEALRNPGLTYIILIRQYKYHRRVEKKKKTKTKESTIGYQCQTDERAPRRVFSAVHIRTHLNSVSAQTDRLKVSIFAESGVLRKRAPYSLQEVVTQRRGPV